MGVQGITTTFNPKNMEL